MILKLVYSQMLNRPGRALLTIFGIVASTCAVIWIVSGYDALVAQFDENSQKYLGRYDALILPSGPPGTVQTIDEQLIETLKHDAGVMELNPINQTRVTVVKVHKKNEEKPAPNALTLLVGSKPPVYGAPPIDPVLVSTPAISSPYELIDGEWLNEASDNLFAVLGISAAEQIGATVGDTIRVTSLANQLDLKVIGIIDQARDEPILASPPLDEKPIEDDETNDDSETPGTSTDPQDSPAKRSIPTPYVEGPAINALYVRPTIAEKINGFSSRANVLQVTLRDGVTPDDFRSAWARQLQSHSPPLRIVDYAAIRKGMESTYSIQSQRAQAWTATGMASVAAMFIIFTTLSMGVTERIREFAMLRSIALTRYQVALMIFIESVILAVTGWLLGLLAGWLMINLGSQFIPTLFAAGATLGYSCAILSGITVLIGALAAAILPAWRALRISPLDRLQSSSQPPSTAWLVTLGVNGVLLCATTPLSVFILPFPDHWRTWVYSVITWPALVLGMILICPVAIVLGEKLFGPVVSRLFQLDPNLVRTQLSSNIWRTVGAALALSLGLGLFVSAQTWGHSMLQPFLPGKWVPDALVAFHPNGLDENSLAKITAVEGIKSDQVMPMAVEQAQFTWPDGNPPGDVRYDNAVLFGIDPQLAFGDERQMIKADFVIGDKQKVIEALAKGDACVISQDFHQLTGITVGDELNFMPPSAEHQTRTYKVAGVVALPGWHWITKFSGVRRHFVRTATMIFAKRESVAQNFNLDRTEFFWFNLQPGASLENVEKQLQSIATSNVGSAFQTDNYGDVTAYRPVARVTATETVKTAITMTANYVFWDMSQLPLITLMIMSLAVANAIVASVRARTWELAVLRSVGLTRWQLTRLVLVEAVLIALVACVLSFAFGLIAGWCGVGMARYGRWFAGPPVFLVPWMQLLVGFLLTLAICLVAAILPAVKVGFSEPLKLLKTARSVN